MATETTDLSDLDWRSPVQETISPEEIARQRAHIALLQANCACNGHPELIVDTECENCGRPNPNM